MAAQKASLKCRCGNKIDFAPLWLCWTCYDKRTADKRSDWTATRQEVWEKLSPTERDFMKELNDKFSIKFVTGYVNE